MKNLKSIVSVVMLLALSIIVVSAQTPSEPNRNIDRQVGVLLQRLERSSNRFRKSLNQELVRTHVDQSDPQNDINSYVADFDSATTRFREQLTSRRAGPVDMRNILQKASFVDSFMTRNWSTSRSTKPVQNHWATVRSDLNALANAYGVSWRWNRQTLSPVNSKRRLELSDDELSQLIQRVEIGGDRFRSSLTEAFDQTPYDSRNSEGNMNDAVRGFKKATDELRNQFDARHPVATYVQQVFARAIPLDTYMRSNRLTNRAQFDWATLRGDLNTLADAYKLDASRSTIPQTVFNSNNRLTGTYRLDLARSDNPWDKADRAIANLPENEQQVVRDEIMSRLASPERLALDRRGSTVTIASSLAPQTTFEADARERQEQLTNGRTVRVTGTLRGEHLVVNSNGYRENDFNVTFDATENDRTLRVRRQIYSDRLTQPVVVDSAYDRISDVAQWSVYQDLGSVLAPAISESNGEFIVRDSQTVVAILNLDLSPAETKQGDRFTMTVREPGQYEGAIIEGTVTGVDRGGRLTGRSGMSLTFDSIWLRNGKSYKFAGILENVRTLNSETVTVDNEGSAQGDNQTSQTVRSAGIGTAIGAIVGGIAGGAKGAVIGAVVGAAGGAGSVYVQGKDNLELPKGTELTIRSSAPVR